MILASMKVDHRPQYRGTSVKRVLRFNDSNDDDNKNGRPPVAKKTAAELNKKVLNL